MTLEKNIFDLSNFGNLILLDDKKKIIPYDLGSNIQKIKGQLLRDGIGPGHKVIINLENTKGFCDYFFACWEVGACIVPISPLSTKTEIDFLIKKIKPSMIVFIDGKIEVLKNSTLTMPDNVLILHTSGSSGHPKGVMLSQQALISKMNMMANSLPINSFDRTLCMLPLNFGHGLISNFLFPFLNGNQVILAPSGQMEIYSSLGEIIDEFGISCFSSVPSILKIAANFSIPPERKSLKNIFCASAPLDKKTWEVACEWSSGISVNNMYGMTELASWIAGNQTGNVFEENSFDSVWGANVKLWKENQNDEYGEILVKSDSLMTGYYEELGATQKVLHEGWFKTGDMGIISNDKLQLKGRVDNVINLGGIKIYPEEINQLIRKMPRISDCYTVGLKLKENEGDIGIGCLLIPRQGEEISIQEVQSFCKDQLSVYKIPNQFKILERMPTNERGKIEHETIKKIFQMKGKEN